MDRGSLSRPCALAYALVRVYPDGAQEPVSRPGTFIEGWTAGQNAVHGDHENAYALYRGERRIARFCHHRLMLRAAGASLDALTAL